MEKKEEIELNFSIKKSGSRAIIICDFLLSFEKNTDLNPLLANDGHSWCYRRALACNQKSLSNVATGESFSSLGAVVQVLS